MKAIRRSILRHILPLLPQETRYNLMRNQLKVSYLNPEGLEFRVARTKEELEKAYQILHDSYVEQGYMTPDECGLRVTKYFALPSTTTLIALVNNEVVGTMSIIRKSALGLPLDKIFDISHLEKNGKIVAEVSSLAIDKKFRQNRGRLFLPLIKYFYEFITQYMRIDRCVIAVNPSMNDFYEGFLCFKRLENKTVEKYEFANGAPAVGLWADFDELKIQFKRLYNQKNDEKNLYKYFVETRFECFKFPDRSYSKTNDPVMTPQLLNYFFYQKTRILKDLPEQELLAIAAAYPQKDYCLVLPHAKITKNRETRHTVNFRAKTLDQQKLRLVDVSRSGIKVHGLSKKNQRVKILIDLGNRSTVEVEGEIKWHDAETGFFGIQLLALDDNWKHFMDYLDSDFEQLVSNQ